MMQEERRKPTHAELLNGRSAVGVIRYARLNEGPEGGYTDEDLFIEIEAAGPDGVVTLLRTVQSPLLRTGAGRTLVGREVRVRHTTLDPVVGGTVIVIHDDEHAHETGIEVLLEPDPGSLRDPDALVKYPSRRRARRAEDSGQPRRTRET